MDEVVDFEQERVRRSFTKPQKNAGAVTSVPQSDFESDDEVTNLLAAKRRMAEMLARPDIHERDFAAINKDYRRVIWELKEARERVEASGLGARRGLKSVGGRAFDGDV